MNDVSFNGENRVQLRIKYVSFVTNQMTISADTNKTLSMTDFQNFKFPKGWYPVGITYFGTYIADETAHDTRISIAKVVTPFYNGADINQERDSNQLAATIRTVGSAMTNGYFKIEFACIPVEYVDTHLSEYNLWESNS